MTSVAALLADLIGEPANAHPKGTPAKVANPANRKHPCGLAADFDAAKALRISANPPAAPAAFAPDSQTFAADSQTRIRPESEQRRGSSQDSQDSRGYPPQRASATARACVGCLHLLPRKTCGKPVEAGLTPRFEIIWPETAHAATCPAFESEPTPPAQDRPYRLMPTDADAAHAEPWDEAAIARFVARVSRFLRLGIDATDADDLAERMHLRDVQGGDHRLCLECAHLGGHASAGWLCRDHRAAGVSRDLRLDLVTTLQRCSAFKRCVS